MPPKKRGEVTGFDGVHGAKTAARLASWTKNRVESDWKQWRIEKIRYTRVQRTFRYGVHSFSQTFISPFGAKESIKKRKTDKRVKSTTKSLPAGVVEALGIPENFDSNDVVIEVDDDGDLGFAEFYVILCRKCHFVSTGFMNGFVLKYKAFLPTNPTISDIMDNWDKVIAKHPGEMKHIDVLGCILPHQQHVHASPNERNFIVRPAEHASSKCHKWTAVEPSIMTPLFINVENPSSTTTPSATPMTTPLNSPSGSSSSLASPPMLSPPSNKRPSSVSLVSPTSVKKQKTLTVALDGTVTVEKMASVENVKTGKTATITIKNSKQPL